MGNVLQPRYSNRQVWHYSGGNCSLLEEELVQQKPSHDDIKDALASAIEIAQPPSFKALVEKNKANMKSLQSHPRFGGIV
jgi:hypothetical protein